MGPPLPPLRSRLSRLRETAPRLFLALRALRHLAREERPDPLTARILAALCGGEPRVLGGPFAGIRFLSFASGSGLLPKIAGTYELEIQPAVEASLARGYVRVVNIGCGEGYYAVGYAWRLPAAEVHAFDLDALARQRLRRLARLNRVAGRLRLGARCRPEDLAALAGPGCLVVCDCEGCEKDLLDPIRAPRLAATDLLVELHDFVDPSITETVVGRFRATHDVEILPMRERDPAGLPLLAGLSPEEQRFAVWEGRPEGMRWAWARARSR